jgi:sulfite reductase (NADPH) flavoprotein alpha-component
MIDLKILFGSQTGNARNLAEVLATSLEANDISAEVVDMSEMDPEQIGQMNHLLIVTSTYGDGEPPDNASEWMSYLKFEEDLKLEQLFYAVLGLGDPYYPHFCQCAKDFDYYLSKKGGKQMLPLLACDRYYEEQYGEWLQQLIGVLKKTDCG